MCGAECGGLKIHIVGGAQSASSSVVVEMKNLALQGEVCHVLPTECTNRRPSKIVSVIHNNDNNRAKEYYISSIYRHK